MVSVSHPQFRQLPLWRRVILILLVPVVFPVSLIVVFALLLPVAVMHGTLTAFYWIRFKLTGTPMPPKGLRRAN